MKLSAPQVESFFEKGWFVQPAVFDARETAEMRGAFERLYRTAQELKTSQLHQGSSFVLKDWGNGVAVNRVVWCGAAEPVLLKYGADPRLLAMAAELLGSTHMQQLINQAHFKLPGDKVFFPWHQDIQHRDKAEGDWQDVNGRGSYVQTLTAIDDVGADNGPLFLIPGSGKLGRVDLGGDGYNTPTNEGLVDASVAEPALMNAGDVLVFGPYTIHGSFPNTSPRPRRVFINGYAYPGANARIYPGDGSGRVLSV